MPDNIETYQNKKRLKGASDIFIGWSSAILLISVTILFGLAILWLNHDPSLQHTWETFSVDKKVPASFCEQLHLSKPIRQPVNTFSNIIYLIIAIIILKAVWNKKHFNAESSLLVKDDYSVLFGLILLYVFAASTFYHSSLISIAHTLDYSAVFSFTLFPTMLLASRLWFANQGKLLFVQKRKSKILFLSAFLSINLLLVFLLPKGRESLVAIILVILFLGVAIATILFGKKKFAKKYLILSITSVLIAVLWFELDKYKILCNPLSYFQFHSLWNIFIGMSAFCFYLHMRTEENLGLISETEKNN